nr:CRC domain-containing protein TSO1-like isoform X1 [Ipomoea batatas]
MDSPVPSKTTATPTSAAAASSFSVSESAAVQVHFNLFLDVEESPFSNYLSSLSPIGPVKTAIVVQDFPGIITPPHVFTSPRINPRIASSFLERGPFLQLPNEEFSVKDDSQNNVSTLRDQAGSSNTQLNSGFVPRTDKVSDNNSPVQEQTESQPICVDDFLVDAAKLGSVDSKNSSLQQADGLIGSKESVDLKGKENKNNNEIEMATGDINSMKTNGKKRVDDAESVPSSKMQPHSSLENQYDHRGTSEAGEHQRGVFRRCLQFEDVQPKTALTPDPCNLSESVNCSNSAVSPIALEALESFPLNTPTAQSSRQFGDTQNTENSSFKTPKPSGIGLHLNSIVSTVQGGSGATVSMTAERGNFSLQGKKLMSMTSHLEKSKKCLISSNVGEDILASIEESSLQGESSAPLPLHSVKPIDSIASLKPMKCLSTPGNKRKSSSENIDGTMASNQSSPKKKRQAYLKKTSDASDGDGCKRCNCKRSKCLKLYCDCFAAGIYCAEPCACQGCFNRPEYEDTVLETRQQIESRNPLAFAPKVVQHMTDSHSNIVGDTGVSFTPSSARHKRGCNCKRSMCLKKYCECYQANVGCSSGCRCEGCKNVYGQKEEYGRIKTLVKKLGTFEQTELSNPHNLTPLTPSFQCSDHRNDASKSWFTSGRCSQSPESGHTLIPRYGVSKKGFTKSSDNPESIEETTDIMDLVSFDPEMEDNNSAAANEYSPGEMNQLVVLPNSQQWVNDSRERLYAGPCHLSSTSSFGWRSSPMTPMTQYDGSKEFYESINSGKSSFNAIEDDTPEILKDASTPPGGVKVSSPNKKRVSPPHGRLKDPDDGSSSARRLKAGRKYKLGSVPSFPPLTPCFVSKGSSEDQIKNDTQKPSSSP